jgi:hypothetical protein
MKEESIQNQEKLMLRIQFMSVNGKTLDLMEKEKCSSLMDLITLDFFIEELRTARGDS